MAAPGARSEPHILKKLQGVGVVVHRSALARKGTNPSFGVKTSHVNGGIGLRVPPRDAAALETSIERLVLHPEQAAEVGQASLE